MTLRPAAILLFVTAMALHPGASAWAQRQLAQATQPARPEPAPPPQPVEAISVDNDQNARETRERLRRLLDQYPPSVRDVLRLDTSLLSRPDYLQTYPVLAGFLAQHPEVAHNPRYFVGEPDSRNEEDRADPRMAAVRAWSEFWGWIGPIAIVLIITSALVGLIRTLADQFRWRRAVRLQVDMQNKLVDRFTNTEELLSYLQSPAGRSLTDLQAPAAAAPGALRAWDTPLSRIFWPLQAGIVATAAGIGLAIVGHRVSFEEFAQPIAGAGILAVAVGIGLVVSAAASYLISHRLGLVAPAGRSNLRGDTPGA